jgi:aminoglycoside phosphotransferase (APT) family kinase protein
VTVNAEVACRLIGVLRGAADEPGLQYARPPEPMHGGFWADIYSFSLASPPAGWPQELVVRLMPDPATARKETIVQAAVAAAGFPTPSVRASGGPDRGLGRAFMVMDKAAGRPLLSGLDGVTPALVRRLARQIPDLLAGSMARLHALDPDLVRGDLDRAGGLPVTERGLIAALGRHAAEFGRPDLVAAARWLASHPPAPVPHVICHGDLHPFNLLADGDRVTLLDWSSALIGPPGYDVAFTSLLLREPPMRVASWQKPGVRTVGGMLARRFTRAYQRTAKASVTPRELAWHQAVHCLRALVEVASWVHDGTLSQHAGHPWLVTKPAFARRLAALTGARITS